MIELQSQVSTAKSEQEKEYLRHQIKSADNKIDKVIYRLYKLTPKEIAIVEK
jgi:hypothetical protein